MYIICTNTQCIYMIYIHIYIYCMHIYIYTMYTCYLIDIHYIHSTQSHLGHLTLERGFKMFCVSFLLGSFSFVFKFLFGIEPFVSIESIEFLFGISCFESFLLALDCFVRGPSSTMKLPPAQRFIGWWSTSATSLFRGVRF